MGRLSSLIGVVRGGANLGMRLHSHRQHQQREADHRESARAGLPAVPQIAAAEWHIELGIARGELRASEDPYGYFAGDIVAQTLSGAARGTLVLGGMGTGKTQFLLRDAAQAVALPATAVVALSAKTDFAADVERLALRHRSSATVYRIGPGREAIDIFGGLSPEQIGDAMGALVSDPRSPKFWPQSVGNLVSAIMQLAKGLEEEVIDLGSDRLLSISYSPSTLSDMIYLDHAALECVVVHGAQRFEVIRQRDTDRGDALESALSYFAGEYYATLAGDLRTLSNVRSSLSPYLRAMTAPEVARVIGPAENAIDLPTALDRGDVVILDIDAGLYQRAFAAVSSFLLVRLQSIALARVSRAENNPVIVLADEYGTYASEQHLALWETARQARICSCVSIISLTSLAARVGEKSAYSLPAAFGSLVCFGASDGLTRRYVGEHIGAIRVTEESRSKSDHVILPTYSTSFRETDRKIVHDRTWSSLGVHPASGELPAHARALVIVSPTGGLQFRDVIMVPQVTS